MKFSQILPSKIGSREEKISPLPRLLNSPQPHYTRKLKSKEIYGLIIARTRELVLGLSSRPVQVPDLESICEAVDSVIEILESGPSKILEFIERSTPEDYLPGHLANVAVLSIALAQKSGLPKESQRAIGVAALLHDSGEIFRQNPDEKRKIPASEEERKRQRIAPRECLEILKGFLHFLNPDSRAVIERVILQCHERISGDGYPNKLKGSEISQEAQVVGLSHAYESLSHPRPYRPRLLSHDTLRRLIELAGVSFDGLLIKKLWEILSLFPPGSFVKLNNGQVARVLEIRTHQPIKPIVKAVVSSSGLRLREELAIDLFLDQKILIERAVDECSLKVNDPALHLELKAQKWWME